MTPAQEPTPAAGASRRLLEGASGAAFEAEGALLLAAAGALAASSSAGTGAAGSGLEDPGLALVAAAGAAADGGPGRPEELAALARAVPPEELTSVLSATESLLARVDARWAWSLIQELAGADAAVQAGLGLDVAARIAIDEGTEWAPGVPLPDAEARVLLVAAAAIDPGWALELATEMLETHTPARLREALRLVAGSAARAGLGDRVAAKAAGEGFVSEQATWAAAAASAGALRGTALRGLTAELAPRVEDELDPGRELVAGLPLLEALAHGGEAGALVELAERWRVPPPLLAGQLFHAEAATGAAALLGSLADLTGMPPAGTA
jgi:hypothetical protein